MRELVINVQEYVFYVFQNPKTRLLMFFEVSCRKWRTQKAFPKFPCSQRQFSLFSTLKLLTDTFNRGHRRKEKIKRRRENHFSAVCDPYNCLD